MTSLLSARGYGVAFVVSAVSITACGTVEQAAITRPSFDPATTVQSTTTVAAPAAAESDPTPPDSADDGVETIDGETDPATGTEGADPDGASPTDGNDASCLVGSWAVGDAELNAWYDVLAENSGLGAEIDTIGEVLITFGASDFTYTGDFDVDILFNGAEGTGSSTGSAAGAWTAVDGTIATDGVESDLSASVVLGDATIDGATIGNGFDTVNPVAGAPYSCDGPTLSFQAGPDETFRHTVTLTPT